MGYEATTLGEFLDATDGSVQTGPFGTKLKASEYTETGVPVISVGEVGYGRIRLHDKTPRVDSTVWERMPEYLLKTDDIVFGRKGAVERSALIQPNEDGYFLGSDGIRVRLNSKECDPRFIAYQFQSAEHKEWMIQHAAGTTMPSLNEGIIRRIPIVVPPLPRQKAIAHILGTLDDKVELNRRMNTTLEGMAQALFKSWFVDFDPVIDNALAAGNPIPDELAPRAKVRRQALANTTTQQGSADHPTLFNPKSLFPAAFQFTEELGWIPNGWNVRHLADEVQLTMGQSPSSDHYNMEGNGLPFHQGVTNYGARYPRHVQFSTAGNRFAEDGDVLFSVRAPVGRINLADQKLIIGRGLAALRHKMEYQGFLIYFLKQTFATEDSIGSGTIFNAVNKKEMERIPLIVPPDGITRAFDDFVNSLDGKIASNAEQAETLTSLRDTLLPKLISGELRIPSRKHVSSV